MSSGAASAVGVDLGTTYTCAAVADGRGGAPRVVQLTGTSQTVPSVVSFTDDGIVAGEAAERRLSSHPTTTAREFKRRLGDATPIVLGTEAVTAEQLTGHLLREVLRRVTENEGETPAVVGLSHPASWGPFRLDLLRDAARHAGVDDVVLVPEPVAAAIANRDRVESGSLIAVYDLGGGTFDAALVRVGADDDAVEVVGTPEGVERLGGIDFDQAVMSHVDAVLDGQVFGLDRSDPDARGALMRLRGECQSAKEHLSQDSDVDIPVSLPGLQTSVRMTRAEFESAVRPRLADSLAVFDRVVASAGVAWDDVDAVLLVGGSSNIPIVGQIVGEHTGRPVITATSPHLAIATGTAMMTAHSVTPTTPSPVVPGVGPGAAGPAAATPSTGSASTTDATMRSRVPLVVGGLIATALAVGGFVLFSGGGGDGDPGTESAATTVADAPDDTGPDGTDTDPDPDTDADPDSDNGADPDSDNGAESDPDTDADPDSDNGAEPDEPTPVALTIEPCTTVASDTVAVLATDAGALVVGPTETRLVAGLSPADCSIDPAGGIPIELAAPGTPIAAMSFGPLYAIVTDQSGLVGSVEPGSNRECGLIDGPGAINPGGAVFSISDDGTVERVRTIRNNCEVQDNSVFLGVRATAVGVGSADLVAIGGTAGGEPVLRTFTDIGEGIDLTDTDLPGLSGVDAIIRCGDRWCAIDLVGGLVHVVGLDGIPVGAAPIADTPMADAVAVRSASPAQAGSAALVTAELADGSVVVVTFIS